ncbi:MAG: flavin reductase family protein [Chitinophagales bacterium]|nr:flavin reductase family protein [Chitinophagales bacterium]
MNNIKRKISRYLNTRKLHAVAISEDDTARVVISSGRQQYDVQNAHALLSLKPFAIAVNAAAVPDIHAEEVTLQIIKNEKVLGALRLTATGKEATGGLQLLLFEATLTHQPFHWPEYTWNILLLSLKNSTNKKSQNFMVPPDELLKLFVFSLKPRPVYLVSVQHDHGYDIFPVDIAGSIDETHCIYSIRSSSAVIPMIKSVKRICAATVPFDQRQAAYRLGHYHQASIVPEADAVPTVLSQVYRIPVPAFAVQVQELLLEHSFSKGVHTQFVFRVAHHYAWSKAPVLGHTPWFNRHYFRESSAVFK